MACGLDHKKILQTQASAWAAHMLGHVGSVRFEHAASTSVTVPLCRQPRLAEVDAHANVSDLARSCTGAGVAAAGGSEKFWQRI